MQINHFQYAMEAYFVTLIKLKHIAEWEIFYFHLIWYAKCKKKKLFASTLFKSRGDLNKLLYAL